MKENEFEGFSEDQIRLYAAQLLQALVFLEKRDVIHCDLKPDNILCHKPSSRGVDFKIGDFGIARILGKKAMEIYYTRYVWGTICYMAPEALRQEPVTTAADMWYLLFYEYKITINVKVLLEISLTTIR